MSTEVWLTDDEIGIVLQALNDYRNTLRGALDPDCHTNGKRYERLATVTDLYQRLGEYDDAVEALHVLPVNDLIDHEDSDECICGPASTLIQRADGSDGWVVTHNSLDGREHKEQA